jgi:hypothetical protein
MVAISIPVANQGYEDGVEKTRGQKADMSFTQDWGDGTVVESEWVPSAKTRAAIGDGVNVLIVVRDATDDTIISYELSQVSDGELPFSVPSEGQFDVVFYSENNNSVEGIDPGDFINSVEEGVETKVTGKELNTPYKPGEGITFEFGTGKEVTGSGTTDLVDAMTAFVSDTSAADLAPGEGGSLPSISFKHAFALLNWTFTLVPVKADGTTLSEASLTAIKANLDTISAGFFPHYDEATINLGLVDGSSVPWTPTGNLIDKNSTFAQRGTSFGYRGSGSGEGIDAFPPAVRFIPKLAAGGDDPALLDPTLCVDTMGVAYKVYRSQGVADKSLTITQGASGAFSYFEAGYSYSVASTIKKAVPNISATKFAASNIYWDGTKLTFDEEDIPGVSHMRPGVLFKWGSLVGISANTNNGAAFTSSTVVYRPVAESDNGGNEAAFEAVSAGNDWASIAWEKTLNSPPAMPASTLFGTYGASNLNRLGDICAYISGGEWRIPVQSDFPSIPSELTTPVAPLEPGDTGYDLVTLPNSSNSYESNDPTGQQPLANIGFVYVATNNELAILPLVGRREGSDIYGNEGSGTLMLTEDHRYWWGTANYMFESQNPDSDTFSVLSRSYASSRILAGFMQRNYACPVRCVKVDIAE